MATFYVTKVRADRVAKVYSGRPGCMCGCVGKWRYRPGAAGPGYEVDRSDRSVEALVRSMNALLSEGYAGQVDAEAGCVYIETSRRVYAAYFA